MAFEITSTHNFTVTGKQTTELLRQAYKASRFIAQEPAAVSTIGTWSGGEWQFADNQDGTATFAARNADRTPAFIANYLNWQPVS